MKCWWRIASYADGDYLPPLELSGLLIFCLMGERKLKIVDVARETGLNRNTVTLLYKETAQRIDLEAIDKLCELFECEVGELLEKVAD